MSSLGNFVWSIADQLRGVYKPHQYGGVILPFTILRRLDCILEPTRDEVRALAKKHDGGALDVKVRQKTGFRFYNTSEYDFAKLLAEPDQLRSNLIDYISRFSANIDVFERFKFENEIATLDEKGRLYLVVSKFADVDLHPHTVPNAEMGDLFEELIRKFAEASNEEAGEHYTPRDAIRLMVDLLFAEDTSALLEPGVVRSIYDPTAGTGGMLSVAEERLLERNPKARLALFGQEINDQSYAICKSDMIAKGQDATNIQLADTLADDKFAGRTFDFCMSNPPYGVDWKASQASVKAEAAQFPQGRFGHGLPPVSDGQMLFLTHLAHKMRPAHEGGGRAGIVLNGSPLFNGGAESGPSEIRRWLLESDLVDAIVALPTSMFFNTGIATYIWILDNTKEAERKGKVQLIDATAFWTKMRKNLGAKGREVGADDREKVVSLYDAFEENDHTKILDIADFGYWTITVERPLVDEAGKPITDSKGRPKPDAKLRDIENVPFTYDGGIEGYFKTEVLPHVSDAWIDEKKTKVGYEIPFTRHFYEYVPPRPLAEIDADLEAQVAKILDLLKEVEGVTVELNPFAREAGTYAAIGSAFTVTLGKMLDGGREVADEATVLPYVRAGNLQDSGLDLSDANSMPFTPAEASTLDLRAGDVLVVEGGAVGTSVVLAHDMPGWSFQKTVNRLRPVGDWDARYVSYVLRAYRDAGVIDIVCNKSTIPHLTAEKLRALRIPAWQPSRQRSIADYLDHETAQIDELITEQRRLIDLLAERRRAVLDAVTSEATGGLVKLKYLFSPSSDANYPDEQVLSVYRDFGVIPKSSRGDNFNRTPDNVERYLLVRPGDLVVNRMKAWQGSLGISDHRGIVSGDYEVARPSSGRLLPGFAHMFLRSPKMITEYAIRSTGIRPSQWRLYWDQMGSIEVPVPDREHQEALVARLREQVDKIDNLVSAADRLIELAQERRSALITAAVSGQIEPEEGA